MKRGGVVGGLVTLLALTIGVAEAQALGEVSPAGEESFAEIAACSADSDRLLVSTVVDESGSLRETDPENQRVDALLAALDSLERLGSTTDLTVEANLATFGSEYNELVGWGQLEGSHAEELRDTINEELPARNSAPLTDYREALSGAQEALEDRRQASGEDASACKIMLWLSDGRLDVDDIDGDQPVTRAAREEICSPGGLIDGVRADKVAVIALGLLTDDTDDLDRDRLQAVAEGSGGAETCGTTPVSGTNGAFLHADDAGALDRIFAQTVALIEGASGAQSFTCPSDECADGLLEFPVDEGVGSFRLVLQSAEGAATPELLTPGGDRSVLDPSADLGGSTSVATSGSLTTIDVRDVTGDTGVWTLEIDPEATTVVDLYYFWGIRLVAEAPEGVLIGEPSELLVRAVDRQNDPANLDVLSNAEFTVPDDETFSFTRGQEPGTWTTTVEVDEGSTVHLKGEATATTTPSGIRLGPVALETTFETAWPPSFPTVKPAVIDLGRLSGETSTSTEVTVTGADRGPTSVCFEPAELTAPDLAGDVTLVPVADGCIDIPAGGETSVDLEFSAGAAADGRIVGELPILLYEVDADEPRSSTISVEGTMIRPVDEATRWGLVGLFVLIALVVAWAVASITRRIFAKFNVSPFARYAEVPVVISPSGVSRRDGKSPLTRADQLRVPSDQGRRTSMQVGPAIYSMHYPLNPLAEARGLVTGSGGQVPITDVKATTKDPTTRYVEVPGTAGFVVITEKPDDSTPEGSIRGTLIILLDPGRSNANPAEILATRVAELGRVQWGAEVERARIAWQKVAATAAQRAESRLRRKNPEPVKEPAGAASEVAPPSRRNTAGPGERAEHSVGPPPRRARGSGVASTGTPANAPPARRGSSATSGGTSAPEAPPSRRRSSGPRSPARDSGPSGPNPPSRRAGSGASPPPGRRPGSGSDDAPPGPPPRRR